jgi:hypothetical protein
MTEDAQAAIIDECTVGLAFVRKGHVNEDYHHWHPPFNCSCL